MADVIVDPVVPVVPVTPVVPVVPVTPVVPVVPVTPVVPVVPVTPIVPEVADPLKVDKVETKEPEVIEPTKAETDLIALKAEMAKLQADLAKALIKDDSQVALDQAKLLITAKDGLVNDYESVLTGIIASKLEGVPEAMKELIPSNATLTEQLAWLTKAEKAGIFKPSVNPDIEIGKPLNPKDSKQSLDTSKLSASAIMALAYGSSKPKTKK
jgi:hypothetical protein